MENEFTEILLCGLIYAVGLGIILILAQNFAQDYTKEYASWASMSIAIVITLVLSIVFNAIGTTIMRSGLGELADSASFVISACIFILLFFFFIRESIFNWIVSAIFAMVPLVVGLFRNRGY